MDKAKILLLCNEIETIMCEIYNTGHMMQICDYESVDKRLKAISAEITAPPKSNADRIRQMMDEELATQLEAFICHNVEECRREDISCIDCALKWLKQEVKTDDERR